MLRGLTLFDLERATGIADTMLSALERGEQKLRGRRLERLASYYSTPASRLVDEMRAWAARTGEDRLSAGGGLNVGEPPDSAA